MIKDLVVPITKTTGDAAATAAAIAIASQYGAHLTMLEFVNMPMLPTDPWGCEVGLGDLYARFREDAESGAVAWRERLAQQAPSISSEVRIVDSLANDAPRQAALHARYGDLTVMAMATPQARDLSIVGEYFASLLLDSGRPVLLVPAGHVWAPNARVVVAWQPKREATRSLHDAMPFLQEATAIDLLAIGEGGDAGSEDADIAVHLARHGLKVEVARLPRGKESVAGVLVRHARESGAGLIIAGGYGHSRLQEWVMGGVTQELLSGTCPVPILFSH